MTVLDSPRNTPLGRPRRHPRRQPAGWGFSQRLTLRVCTSVSVTVVTVTGQLDGTTGPALGAQLAVVGERGAAVAVDLREVEHCDAAGVSVLVTAHANCAVAGVPFAVVAPAEPVRRLLHQVGIETLFTVTESAGELTRRAG